MSNQSFTKFTHDGIPPLPPGPDDNIPMQEQHPIQFPQIPAQGRPDHGIPQFEIVAKRNKDGSYKNVEYVSILTPGDPKAVPRHKVTDEIRDLYRPYYERWKRGLEVAPEGVPLEMFPRLTPAQVQELKALNIFTVEQLADVADANIHRIPMGATLKQDARKWLDLKNEADAAERMTRENDALKAGQALLREQNAELMARLEALEKKEPENIKIPAAQMDSAESDMADALSDAVDKAANPKRRRPRKNPE